MSKKSKKKSFNVGDKVKYIGNRPERMYFPVGGTIGTVTQVDTDDTIEVNWGRDSGTMPPYTWWIPNDEAIKVK